MCNPQLIGGAGIAATVAGTLGSTFSAYRSSKQNKAALRYQASVARNNEILSEWEAQDALNRGAKEEQRHRLNVAGLKGSQRASFASRGIALDEGTPLRVLTDTDFLGELDAQVIRQNADREASTARSKGRQYRSDAKMLDYGADQESPMLAGGTALLTGAGQVASSWYRQKRETG